MVVKILSVLHCNSFSGTNIVYLEIDKIKPNPFQPRRIFDEAELQELALSIKEYGIIQPVVVFEENDVYYLIVGERRWRASGKAGLKEIPALVKIKEQAKLLEIALIENIQRSNLNILEEAEAYLQLYEEFGLSHDEIARKVCKSRSVITNTIRLLKLPEEVKECLEKQMISAGHARALLMFNDKKTQVILCGRIIREGLTVRYIEELAGKNDIKDEKKLKRKEAEIFNVEEDLQILFGTKVEIKQNKKDEKGKIEISYYSIDDLNRIIDIITKN
jgi:ParB family chromosome partitioning protein